MAKCSNCGFLAKYCPGIHIPTPNFFEMDTHARTTGKAFQHAANPLGGLGPSFPVCFRGVLEFEETFKEFKDPGQQEPGRLLNLLRQERSCSSWCEYSPGFSPKEHFAFMKFEEIEIKRQKFEQKMQSDHEIVLLNLDKRNRRFSLIIGIFAAAEVFAAFAQMAFPSGWPWLQSLFGSIPPVPPLPPPF